MQAFCIAVDVTCEAKVNPWMGVEGSGFFFGGSGLGQNSRELGCCFTGLLSDMYSLPSSSVPPSLRSPMKLKGGSVRPSAQGLRSALCGGAVSSPSTSLFSLTECIS
jgi:hypothetical protein